MRSMNRSDVQVWLGRYVEAWRSNDRATIESLFTEDAVYGEDGRDAAALMGRKIRSGLKKVTTTL